MKHICTVDWNTQPNAEDCKGDYPEVGTTVTVNRRYPFSARKVGEEMSVDIFNDQKGTVRGFVPEWHDVHVEFGPNLHVWVDPGFLTWEPAEPEPEEHVFLVALQAKGRTREEAQRVALAYLPNHPSPDRTPGLECWWVAEDDRVDGSDNDSAVFVNPGSQVRAAELLHRYGLTPKWNVPERDSQFEDQP
jgi:hypothetical protein